MIGRKMKYANMALMMLSEVFDYLRLNFAVYCYDSRSYTNNVRLYPIKNFKDSYNTNVRDISGNCNVPAEKFWEADQGYTPTSEALLFIFKRLVTQRERSKKIFLITDGLPNFYGSSELEIEHTMKAINKISSEGMMVYTVFVYSGERKDAFRKVFRHVVFVDNFSELPKRIAQKWINTNTL